MSDHATPFDDPSVGLSGYVTSGCFTLSYGNMLRVLSTEAQLDPKKGNSKKYKSFFQKLFTELYSNKRVIAEGNLFESLRLERKPSMTAWIKSMLFALKEHSNKQFFVRATLCVDGNKFFVRVVKLSRKASIGNAVELTVKTKIVLTDDD